MAKPISGKVARVLNTREIAINVGSTDSVAVDMYFDVMDPLYNDIIDPDTKEVLGSVARPKVRVKITHVEAKLSLATTYRTEKANIGPRVYDFLLPSGDLTTRYETLKQNGKLGDQPDALDESESYVKTGDPVIQVIEATDKEGEVPVENTESLKPAINRMEKDKQ